MLRNLRHGGAICACTCRAARRQGSPLRGVGNVLPGVSGRAPRQRECFPGWRGSGLPSRTAQRPTASSGRGCGVGFSWSSSATRATIGIMERHSSRIRYRWPPQLAGLSPWCHSVFMGRRAWARTTCRPVRVPLVVVVCLGRVPARYDAGYVTHPIPPPSLREERLRALSKKSS